MGDDRDAWELFPRLFNQLTHDFPGAFELALETVNWTGTRDDLRQVFQRLVMIHQTVTDDRRRKIEAKNRPKRGPGGSKAR